MLMISLMATLSKDDEDQRMSMMSLMAIVMRIKITKWGAATLLFAAKQLES